MIRSKWRRFLPKRKLQTVTIGDDIFADARRQIERVKIRDLETAKSAAIAQSESASTALDNLVLLLLRTPAAARAQQAMDEHPHDRHRHQRIYELIDFNDAFVSTVLLLTESQRRVFHDHVREEMIRICHMARVHPFSDEQFDAIVHGLSREIAVYLAANTRGLRAEMTSRDVDAFGVDMRITHEASGRYINIDSKTRSSFHFRMKDLVRDGRLAQEDMDRAEQDGFCKVVHHRDDIAVEIILLRVSGEEFGELSNFRFNDEQLLANRLVRIIEQEGLREGKPAYAYSDQTTE